MRLFLDENVTPAAQQILSDLGHDVVSVQTLEMRGMSDEDVFEKAQVQRRFFVTHNGKDFVVYVPPKCREGHHEGLLWMKHQMTRVNASELCVLIHDVLSPVESLADTVWVLRNREGAVVLQQTYPVEH